MHGPRSQLTLSCFALTTPPSVNQISPESAQARGPSYPAWLEPDRPTGEASLDSRASAEKDLPKAPDLSSGYYPRQTIIFCSSRALFAIAKNKRQGKPTSIVNRANHLQPLCITLSCLLRPDSGSTVDTIYSLTGQLALHFVLTIDCRQHYRSFNWSWPALARAHCLPLAIVIDNKTRLAGPLPLPLPSEAAVFPPLSLFPRAPAPLSAAVAIMSGDAAAAAAGPVYDNVRAMEAIASHVNFAPSSAEDGWGGLPDLPTPEEILTTDEDLAGLPINPIDEPWPSKKAYLESQYRILRCEGVQVLRDSVGSYKKDPSMSDNAQTCIYVDVYVKGYTMCRVGPVCRVSFSTRRACRKIQWMQSRRLTPGTVVAVTTAKDKFRSICKVATVTQRPFTGGLDQTPPEVDISWANIADAVFDPDEQLVMIEARGGYFEAVRHALVGLQHARQTHSILDKYIVDGVQGDYPAAYISRAPNLDLSCLIDHLPASVDTSRPDFNAAVELIKTKDAWRCKDIRVPPTAAQDVTSLDASQTEALSRIVSKELAIIQGPPGTGKTFTSVSALRVLLANRRPGDPPIIVAAQTNHALDQLLLQCQEAGANILRVGGRTESEAIAKRTAFELRKLGGYCPDKDFQLLENRRRDKVDKFVALSQAIFSDSQLLDPAALWRADVITEAQYKSLSNDEWTPIGDNANLGAFDLWLGEQKVPANRRVVSLQDFDEEEVENEGELEYEVDPDLDNLMDDKDEHDRLKGTWVSLQHIWTGKDSPSGARRNQARELLESCEDDDLYNIPPRFRGAVYQILRARFLAAISARFKDLLSDMVAICKDLRVNKWFKDVHLVVKHRINLVGCTTTGLTKYRGFLSALEPRTLLIEEAAETREANIASALYKSLQQLILVGDHQQLTPNCDVHWLAYAPYNLNVSMFERLVKVGVPFTMLNQQRRMRPELRHILNQFYPGLTDHPQVEKEANRPRVPGMGNQNCWWFDHRWPEESDADCSKFNLTEAEMIVNFVGYLVQNGVRIDLITILTFYNGQRKLLSKMLRKNGLVSSVTGQANVFTVDSYQGEENDIVLLSLVRSPKQAGNCQVGFLGNKNRGVVAISRARRGFYIFGNVQNVLGAGDQSYILWGLIFNGFAGQDAVKRKQGLPLVCENHGNQTWAREPDDFVGSAGGCTKRCHGKLPCGHDCKLACHPTPHSSLPCRQPCTQMLNCDHSCSNYCSEPCFCPCNRFQRSEAPALTTSKTPTDKTKALGNVVARNAPITPRTALPTRPSQPSRSAPHHIKQLPVPPPAAGKLSRPRSSQEQHSVEKWNIFVKNVSQHDAQMREERLAAAAPSQQRPLITYEGHESTDNSHVKLADMIVETFKQTGIEQGRRVGGPPKRTQRLDPTVLPLAPTTPTRSRPVLGATGAGHSMSAAAQAVSTTAHSTSLLPSGMASSSSTSPTRRAVARSNASGVTTARGRSGNNSSRADVVGRGRGAMATSTVNRQFFSNATRDHASGGERRRDARGQTEPGSAMAAYGFEAEILNMSTGRRQNAQTEPAAMTATLGGDAQERRDEDLNETEEESLIEF
ncbi:uncharacterized protein E0L32_001206 [Thyridium curvatum]|uniref:Uncharacterized protein n=1 Tax=Thyridium curvatum TaxID=1093900 RepID=A0A507B3A0_9PEZI|nr:uncharacterized protein E0L32_001206 [Thyridium curvatum]TPX11388.1 hypothetical protein E0L32_001206 [Thyridium curvatum]